MTVARRSHKEFDMSAVGAHVYEERGAFAGLVDVCWSGTGARESGKGGECKIFEGAVAL